MYFRVTYQRVHIQCVQAISWTSTRMCTYVELYKPALTTLFEYIHLPVTGFINAAGDDGPFDIRGSNAQHGFVVTDQASVAASAAAPASHFLQTIICLA